MPHYDAYLFDLDGTLYRGAQPITFAVETVTELRRRGAAIRYLTNNSTLTRSAFVAKLAAMGFPVEPHEIMSSGIATALYLQAHELRTAFVVGEPGLTETLREAGISVSEDVDVQAVVVGLCRQFTYGLMQEAMLRIRAGSEFVATNPDTTFPLEHDQLVPGAGSIVAAVAACSETIPVVVGKPEPLMVRLVLEELGISAGQALVVGDRLDTDIACGVAAGCPTHLVLTGVERSAPAGQPSSPDLRALLY